MHKSRRESIRVEPEFPPLGEYRTRVVWKVAGEIRVHFLDLRSRADDEGASPETVADEVTGGTAWRRSTSQRGLLQARLPRAVLVRLCPAGATTLWIGAGGEAAAGKVWPGADVSRREQSRHPAFLIRFSRETRPFLLRPAFPRA